MTTAIQTVPIGTIEGQEVTAERVDEGLTVYAVRWGGLELFTDGTEFVNIQPVTGGCEGDMTLEQWVTIKALAQTDVIEQLLELARAHARLADSDS